VSINEQQYRIRLAARHRKGKLFRWLCTASAWFGLGTLAVLIVGIAWQSKGWLTWSFLTNFDSRHPEEAGVLAGLWGSFWLILLTVAFSVPVGVGAAIYLEEFAADTRLTRIIRINLANLAGVPSIVYGILGLTVFVRMFGLFAIQTNVAVLSLGFVELRFPFSFPFGRTILSGALTMSLLVLPVVIVAAQEALRAVPASIRHASLALGATEWQTVRHQVIPSAVPGILTGIILSVSRAIGETAPLVMIGALAYVASTPGNINSPVDFARHPGGVLEVPFSPFTALPIQVYNWIEAARTEYIHVAAAGILVLLVLLLLLNSLAIFLRYRAQRYTRW
jgi:phosphate transport system permease protein